TYILNEQTLMLVRVTGSDARHHSALSLHDALPICREGDRRRARTALEEGWRPHGDRPGRHDRQQQRHRDRRDDRRGDGEGRQGRSEEHTSELQSRENLVCRLLLEKKNTHCHYLDSL